MRSRLVTGGIAALCLASVTGLSACGSQSEDAAMLDQTAPESAAPPTPSDDVGEEEVEIQSFEEYLEEEGYEPLPYETPPPDEPERYSFTVETRDGEILELGCEDIWGIEAGLRTERLDALNDPERAQYFEDDPDGQLFFDAVSQLIISHPACYDPREVAFNKALVQ